MTLDKHLSAIVGAASAFGALIIAPTVKWASDITKKTSKHDELLGILMERTKNTNESMTRIEDKVDRLLERP